MRIVIQRVTHAQVEIGGKVHSSIEQGLVIFLGIAEADTKNDLEWLCNKIVNLRIFNDDKGVMNVSLAQTGGEILLVSQFTLHASTKKGNRPNYIKAAKPETALPLYGHFIARLRQLLSKEIKAGIFGANMKVSLINDGPVTIIIDSKLRE